MERSFLVRGALAALVIFLTSPSVQADESLGSIVSDVTEYWSPVIEDAQVGEPSALSDAFESGVAPAQMLAPQRNTSARTAQRNDRSGGSRRNSSGLSNTPFMIGDTGAGTCFAFNGLLVAELSHPTLTCSRLNISENNTPLPTDRVYFSYRHFHNASNLKFYQFEESFDVNRFTFGGERTFCDGMMSVEMRLPLEQRLSSNRFSYDVSDPRLDLDPNAFGNGFDPFGGGLSAELGNISLMFKALLYESNSCAISAGVGLTLPTAQDVEYLVTTDNRLIFPNGTQADSSILLDVFGSNETVYISPYLAWLSKQPNSRFFHQGFLQVEVAANPSSIAVAGDGLTNFLDDADPNVVTGTFDWFTPFPSGRTDLFAQTLMRLNLGFGYTMIDDPRNTLLNRLTAMLEFHYTSTLQDAKISTIPISVNSSGTSGVNPIQTIEFGNLLNRVDIVNMVSGLSANCGNWVVTNGFTVPISLSEEDGPFDFEYNLQLQRPF